MLVEKSETLFCVGFVQYSVTMTCIILSYRVNGKQSPNKHAKHGRKSASKNNLHQEGAEESSELSDPEETTIYKAEISSGM